MKGYHSNSREEAAYLACGDYDRHAGDGADEEVSAGGVKRRQRQRAGDALPTPRWACG